MCKHHFLLKLAQLVIGYYTNRNFHQVLNLRQKYRTASRTAGFFGRCLFFFEVTNFCAQSNNLADNQPLDYSPF